MPNVIELDVSQPWLPYEEPERDRRRRPGRRAALLAVLLVAALTGPVAAGSAPMTQTWRASTSHGFFLLTDDAAYTVEPASGRMELFRRDLETGEPRWSVMLDGPLAEVYADNKVVLVSHFPPVGQFEASTRAINMENGDRLWTYPAPSIPLVYLAGDVAVLIDREPVTRRDDGFVEDSFSTGLDRPHRVTVIDLKTGEERARHRIPEGTIWALPGMLPRTDGLVAGDAQSRWIALLDTGDAATGREPGLLEVRDLADWSLTAVGRAAGVFGDRSYLLSTPDGVLIRTESEEGPVFSAYRAKDLSVQWRFTGTELFGMPYVCGDLLCIESEESVWAYRPGTGERVWRRMGLRLRASTADSPLLTTRFGEALTLVDADSGDLRPFPGEWRVVDPVNYDTRSVVVARGDSQGGAELAIVNVRSGRITELGPISTWSGAIRCHATRTHLACVEENELRMWSLSP